MITIQNNYKNQCQYKGTSPILANNADLLNPEIHTNLETLTPREIKAKLDEKIIGQEEAKRVLSVAVYNHYQRISNLRANIEKSNVLLIGPSGTGKTLIAKTLAALLDVPFAIADANSLTAAGYVGDDVENILVRLVQAADGDIKKAERGIVYIDEIDKIGRKSENPSITRDVGGESVQQALLKIIEGADVSIPLNGGRKHPHGNNPIVNTENILFICGGAFEGMLDEKGDDDIFCKPVKPIGFDRKWDEKDNTPTNQASLWDINEKLVKFGMIPELIGRLPSIVTLEPLNQEDFVAILKNHLCDEYKRLFATSNITLSFEKGTLEKIAAYAQEKKIGARGLRSVMESLLQDQLFELPGGDKKTYKVTKKYVSNKLCHEKEVV